MNPHSFDQIFLGGRNGVRDYGKFKLSEAGIGWKNAADGVILTVSSTDIDELAWIRVAREYEVKIVKKAPTYNLRTDKS
jgi:structure-specific recognition protein 1